MEEYLQIIQKIINLAISKGKGDGMFAVLINTDSLERSNIVFTKWLDIDRSVENVEDFTTRVIELSRDVNCDYFIIYTNEKDLIFANTRSKTYCEFGLDGNKVVNRDQLNLN